MIIQYDEILYSLSAAIPYFYWTMNKIVIEKIKLYKLHSDKCGNGLNRMIYCKIKKCVI